MPTQKEVKEIAEYRGWKEEQLFQQTVNDNDDKIFSRNDIGRKYPIFKSTGGVVSPAPNMVWAMEREIDARVEELFSNKDGMTDVERANLSGEMRGISMAYSMYTGRSVEMLAVSALQRYQERHAQTS